MARKRRSSLVGPPCPSGGEEHGGLLDIPGTGLWHCPHAAHYGVVYDDESSISRCIFTDKEATDSQEAYWRGHQ